mmetsp:Transcript_118446/g.204757  ORF Transcript_118446/g.204757 Transcript_118446/m.204757 type:complete len:123 (-) Transcript_118446:28-396(-)
MSFGSGDADENIPVATAHGWGFFARTGGIWHNNTNPVPVRGSQPAKPGDAIGLLINFSPRETPIIMVFKNGVQLGYTHKVDMRPDKVYWMALLSGKGSAVRLHKKSPPTINIDGHPYYLWKS